jgi:RimJ/RimL family protein N-acetyltransferase
VDSSSHQPVPVSVRDLTLRAFEEPDLSDLLEAFADPAIAAWNPGPAPASEAAVREWMGRRNDWGDGGHASWAVADQDGRLCGSVSVHNLDPDQLDAEMGYWVAPWARRRGVGVRSVQAAARFGFTQLGLHRLYLYHAVDNEASCRLALTAGFPLEGQLRQSYRYADGRFHDEHLHARLAEDPAAGSPLDPSGRSSRPPSP